MTGKPIYLDYAAATPLDERALTAMGPYFAENFYNPSATYLAATRVAKDLLTAHGTVAHWLGARPSEIIFTAGGTEANNLAIQGVMRHYPDVNVVVSAVEHESVLLSAALFERRIAPVDRDGAVDLARLAELIDDKTVLVSIMYANNEVGTIQPVREIGKIIKQKRADRVKKRTDRTSQFANPHSQIPLYLHTDAAQAANYLDLHAARLGADLLTLNGGKIYGPKQSGVLFARSGIELQPLILGGGQERGLRSGTENVAAAIGLATALEIAQTVRHEESARLQDLQEYFIGELGAHAPGATINGSRKKRLANNVHVTFPGLDNERLLMRLDEAGIMAAAGSACSASNDAPSHVLCAMGRSDDEARSSIRFTMGRATVRADIDRTIAALKKFLR
jgi:cysteine desulfurase